MLGRSVDRPIPPTEEDNGEVVMIILDPAFEESANVSRCWTGKVMVTRLVTRSGAIDVE